MEAWVYGAAGGVVGLLVLGGSAAAILVCCRKRRRSKGGSKKRRRKSKYAKGRGGEAADGGDDLPEGWEELEDGYGQKYYYNELSETTSWTRPRSNKEKRPNATPENVDVMICPGRTGGVLPAEWEEHQDEDGTPYFYNLRTRRTTWSRPKASNGCASASV